MRIRQPVPNMEQSLGGGVAKPSHLREQSHIGFIGHNARHWRRIVFSFLSLGLARGEQCLYLTTIHSPRLIAALLAQEGVDAEKTRARGQFGIQDAVQFHMPQGWFDPDHVIRQHKQGVERARRKGFTGLRIVADMGWASYIPPGWARLEEYEHRAGIELCPGHYLKMMCCYDEMMFDDEVISSVERTHAVVIGTLGGFRAGPLVLGGPGAGPLCMGTRRGGWPREGAGLLRPSRRQPRQSRLWA